MNKIIVAPAKVAVAAVILSHSKKPIISPEEKSLFEKLRAEFVRLEKLVAEHGNDAADNEFNRLRSSFENDPSEENMAALRNSPSRVQLRERNQRLRAECNAVLKRFAERELAPFITPILARAVLEIRAQANAVIEKETAIARSYGLPYGKSPTVAGIEYRAHQIEQQLEQIRNCPSAARPEMLRSLLVS